MQRRTFLGTLAAATLCGAAPPPLRLGMAGLEHGHASGFLNRYRDSKEVELVGISEPDRDVAGRYVRRSRLDPASVYPTLEEMLEKAKPQAVVAFTSTAGHLAVVTACAARKIPVMMEKPLAVSVEHARAIERASVDSGIPVLVNYETTWYPSNHAAYALAKEEKALGEIRKVVVHDGHRGPKEIGVQPEFLAWLTDPEKNGAGALFDFGCYGANLMTWLMDDARSILGALAVKTPAIQARDLREGGRRGDDHPGVSRRAGDHPGVVELAVRPEGHGDLRSDRPGVDGGPERAPCSPGGKTGGDAPGLAAPASLGRLPAILCRRQRRRDQAPLGLSSLKNNLIGTAILDAARRSAASGSTVRLA